MDLVPAAVGQTRQAARAGAEARTVRVSTLYATSWHTGRAATAAPVVETLRFGRLAPFYRQAATQLPAVLTSRPVEAAAVRYHRRRPGAAPPGEAQSGPVAGGRLWLLAMPSGQVVVALTLDIRADLTGTIDLLEDLYYEDVTIGGVDLATAAASLAQDHGVPTGGRSEFAVERHQLTCTADLDTPDPADLVQRLVYRADVSHRPEYSVIGYPAELNRRPRTLAAIGPYVSVLAGQEDYVEHAAFVSAGLAVAAAARLREIRDALHQNLARFRDDDTGHADPHRRRLILEQIFNDLITLELDLSLSVEVPRDLRLLIPSLPVVNYHEHLYDAIGINHLASGIGRMLRRLESTVRAEVATVESRERRSDDGRRLRWGIAVGFISTVSIPVSLVLAFFSVNAAELEPERSMLDPGYLWVYLGVGLLAATGLGLAFILHFTQRRNRRRGRPHGRRRFRATGST